MILSSSTPSLTEFNPHAIPYQFRVIRDIRNVYDYSLGAHEVLLSGSVGSAKSILMAHLAVTHCCDFNRSRFLLGRQSMPDLKDTILKTVIDHMEGDLVEGEDYEHNETKGFIEYSNGSEIVSKSWADKHFKRLRSVPLSAAAVEELTENDDTMAPFYPELYARLGRIPHVPENFMVCATNPDAPSHWAYKRFFVDTEPNRHVYKSVTTDNPFLPKQYVESLLKNFDPKMARRMIYGEWIEISEEVIYHTYDRAINFRDQDYEPNPKFPIRLNFDFNIGLGKPLSAAASQYLDLEDEFHIFRDFVVQGADTHDILDEIEESELLEIPAKFIVHGDANGKNKDTRSKRSDYDIIRERLSRYRRKDGSSLEFEIQVPPGNPPLRTRHNRVNAYCQNSLGRNRLFVYRKAAVVDEGLRLTSLKKGGSYVEDDSKSYQHVTTAIGYGIVWVTEQMKRKSSSRER
jgi:hypothetical protein